MLMLRLTLWRLFRALFGRLLWETTQASVFHLKGIYAQHSASHRSFADNPDSVKVLLRTYKPLKEQPSCIDLGEGYVLDWR
jgi:hypothetical protein